MNKKLLATTLVLQFASWNIDALLAGGAKSAHPKAKGEKKMKKVKKIVKSMDGAPKLNIERTVEVGKDGMTREWMSDGLVKVKRVLDPQGIVVYAQAWDVKSGQPVALPNFDAMVAQDPEKELAQIEAGLSQAPGAMAPSADGCPAIKAGCGPAGMADADACKSQIATLEQKVADLEDSLVKKEKGCQEKCEDEKKEKDWKVSGQLRDRYETMVYDTHSGAKLANKEFIGQRSRVSASGKVSKRASVNLRWQDTKFWGINGHGVSNGGASELNLANFDYAEIWDKTDMRLGRQELSYGDERVVGKGDWSNQGRTFDALKFTYHLPKNNKIDYFYAKNKEDGGIKKDADFGGIVGQWKKDKCDFQLSWFGKRDNDLNQSVNHFGAYWKSAKNEWDWVLQGGIEAGEVGNSDLEADTFAGNLGYNFKGKRNSRLGFQFSHASGDSNPASGKVKTYDQLYATNHRKYGVMDLFGNRNLDQWVVDFGFKPSKPSELKLAYRQFNLAEKNDSLYDSSGAAYTPVAGAVAGANGSNIGSEIDFEFDYKHSKNLSFMVGGGMFDAGNMVRNQHTLLDDAMFLYAGTNFTF